MAFETAKKWLSSAQNINEIEYILSIDENELEKKEYNNNIDYFNNKLLADSKIEVNNNNNAIEAINIAAKNSTGNIIIVISDDFDCFNDWDYHLIKNINGREDFLAKTSDGIQDWLITLPIMDRKYYKRFGYVYYPEYHHMFSDTEMTEVGDLLGRVIDLKNLYFIHNHYTVGLMQKDYINEKNDLTWEQGKNLYTIRKQNKFFI